LKEDLLKCVKEAYLTPRHKRCIDDDMGFQNQCSNLLKLKRLQTRNISVGENAILYDTASPFSKVHYFINF
jgi:hypothetical protein